MARHLRQETDPARSGHETWYPHKALVWEPQPDQPKVLAIELVASSDVSRKLPAAQTIDFKRI